MVPQAQVSTGLRVGSQVAERMLQNGGGRSRGFDRVFNDKKAPLPTQNDHFGEATPFFSDGIPDSHLQMDGERIATVVVIRLMCVDDSPKLGYSFASFGVTG